MIPFDFNYYRPTSLDEALQVFKQAEKDGQKALFYSGGTEIITFSRINRLQTDVIIDIKEISECNVLEFQDQQLVLGACVSLNHIAASGKFPLLGNTVRRIADHTARNKITLGGNILSKLNYREGILPLLISDAQVKVFGENGEETLSMDELLSSGLSEGKILVQVLVDQAYLGYPFISERKTKFSKVGYPLLSVAALKKDEQIHAAFSGICPLPFRSYEMEKAFNEKNLSIDERVQNALDKFPQDVVDDVVGSAAYRKFVFQNTLQDVIGTLEEASV